MNVHHNFTKQHILTQNAPTNEFAKTEIHMNTENQGTSTRQRLNSVPNPVLFTHRLAMYRNGMIYEPHLIFLLASFQQTNLTFKRSSF